MGSGFVAVTSRGLEIVHPGGAPTSLTTDPGDSDPAWSPDGAWIAFSGIRSGVGGLYTVRATGGEARLVTSYAYTIGDPWRPGAGRDELTVVRDRAIVTVGPEGTGLRDLVARTTIAGKPKVVDAGASTRIVIGTDGPDQDVYRVPLRSGRLELLVENRSSVPWVISGGLTEKDQYCRVVSGPSAQPCTVAPGATVAVAPSGSFSTSALEIGLSPAGTNYFQVALPVILDPVAEP
jgi:dipeptidyl aminopeptidase/acylaminoacyl peptidase